MSLKRPRNHSGPLPSHNNDARFCVDYFAKSKMPTSVEDLCGSKAADLNESSIPLLLPDGNCALESFIVDVPDQNEDSSGFSSFSSNRSDELNPTGVESSMKKLMPSPDASTIEMNSKKGKSDDDDTDFVQSNPVLRCILFPVELITKFVTLHKRSILMTLAVCFALGVTGYMIAALIRNFQRAVTLLVIWLVVVIYNIYALIRDYYGNDICHFMRPMFKRIANNMFWIQWVFVILVVAGLATWIALDTSKRPEQLISGAGYFVMLLGLFVTSKYPNQVKWRPVFWGLFIQVCMGMIILRTQAGFDAFNWLGSLAQTFINYTNAGAAFLFGPNYMDHFFAFKVLPIVIYFSAFISILYYLGAMQWLILKIAFIMQITLNTSATESMVAAGNIFVGQTESPLLIRPYIDDLTTSELHAVMTAGFGTIAGSVLGAYLGFGIQAVYVITACVMASPCALAVSKLVYPETKRSKFMQTSGLVLEKTEHRNIIEAAFVGASQAIPLVLNIGGNLVAFLSLLAAINGFLGWFGGLMDCPQLSFELICSYVFMPLTYLMGIEWKDCFKAAELIGTKIFLNEFIAYESLSGMIKARDNGTIPQIDPITGVTNWVDERTEAIVTYALCGFANIGSLGIMLGGLGSLAPQRQGEMAKIVIRALIAGVFVSILNACVAGFLYIPRTIVCDQMLAAANWTYSDPSRLWQCCSTVVYPMSANSTACLNCCNYDWSGTAFNLDCVNTCV